MNELEQNPEFRGRQRRLMREREANRRRYQEAASGLMEDLKTAGFDVEVVAELRTSGNDRAVPILAGWLRQAEYLPLKRDIIATLGSRWARPMAARPLIEEFYRTPPAADQSTTGLRWFIGDSLSRVADESVLDELIEIASDVGLGRDRSLVVMGLGNFPHSTDRVVPVLIDLLYDPAVVGYAVIALGKLGATEARSRLRELTEHPVKWVRDEVSKALGRIGT